MTRAPIFASAPGVVLSQLGIAPTLETVSIYEPGDDEVLVRIVAAGICHTDYGYMQYARATPVLLGHEAAGVVARVGARVQHVTPGDHVVINWQPKCGKCPRCLAGRRDLCEEIQATAAPRIFWHNEPIHVMLNAGAFCPYVVVPAGGAVKIRRDMPLEKAALLGCAVATGVGAALYTAAVQAGESVVVYGAGGVGLSVVQGARLARAGQIIVVDLDDAKLQLAESMGATHLVNPARVGVKNVVNDVTNRRGVEYVFEAVGRPEIMQEGIDLLARGGALVLIGAADRDVSLAFAPRRFMSMQQRMLGCIFGNIRPEIDLPLFANWYMDGRLKLDEMHTATVGLSDVPALFADASRRHGIRTVVQLDSAV